LYSISLTGGRGIIGRVSDPDARSAVLARGTASGWWPQEDGDGGGGDLVAVEATNGERVCGVLQESNPGSVGVSVEGSPVVVSLQDVAAVAPVDSC
jgi:hypothetical protein